MRVLFAIAHLDKGGGQAVQCQQLYSRLQPRLERSELLALTAGSGAGIGPRSDGTTVVGSLRFPSGIAALRREILRRKNDYDVVHALDIYYSLPAARLARARPLVVRLGSDPIEDLASRWGIWGRSFMQMTTPWMFSETETVVNSPHLLPRVPSGHARFIANGVDLARFALHPDPSAARAELGLPPGVPLLAFTGRALPRKNVEDILWLLTQRPNWHFLWIGNLAEPYYGDRYFRHLAREFSTIMPRVHTAGEVPMERVPRFLEAADLFVFPSRLEGMPNALLEAMASGLPVVASRNPAHTEIVPPGRGFLYSTRDELLARANLLLDDPANARAMAARGREFASERFGFDAAVRQYLALYEELGARDS
jgi:glycosyltransferase involved in cell wall biosynthesis